MVHKQKFINVKLQVSLNLYIYANHNILCDWVQGLVKGSRLCVCVCFFFFFFFLGGGGGVSESYFEVFQTNFIINISGIMWFQNGFLTSCWFLYLSFSIQNLLQLNTLWAILGLMFLGFFHLKKKKNVYLILKTCSISKIYGKNMLGQVCTALEVQSTHIFKINLLLLVLLYCNFFQMECTVSFFLENLQNEQPESKLYRTEASVRCML